MRETAESRDDVEMDMGPPGEIGKAHGGEERDAAHLWLEVLGMLERHDEPARQAPRNGLMKASGDRRPRKRQRLGIARECKRVGAMDIAGELIEHDHQRKRPLRAMGPVVKGSGACVLQRIPETQRERAVEGGILGEPLCLAGPAPEVDHIERPHHRARPIWRAMKSDSALTSSRSKTGTASSRTGPLAAIATTVGS